MKGRNSVMIGIRIAEDVYLIIQKLAESKEMTVSQFIKWKVEELSGKAGSVNHLVNQSVNTMGSVNTIPIYNPSIHQTGDRVLLKQGKRFIESVVPELDADGQAM